MEGADLDLDLGLGRQRLGGVDIGEQIGWDIVSMKKHFLRHDDTRHSECMPLCSFKRSEQTEGPRLRLGRTPRGLTALLQRKKRLRLPRLSPLPRSIQYIEYLPQLERELDPLPASRSRGNTEYASQSSSYSTSCLRSEAVPAWRKCTCGGDCGRSISVRVGVAGGSWGSGSVLGKRM